MATSNKNVLPIQRPLADLGALATVAEQLRQGVESLGGLRGDWLGRAVTFNDLVALGLVSEATIKAKIP
jgi:hypothetical protein